MDTISNGYNPEWASGTIHDYLLMLYTLLLVLLYTLLVLYTYACEKLVFTKDAFKKELIFLHNVSNL